jgi:hypothetical protein
MKEKALLFIAVCILLLNGNTLKAQNAKKVSVNEILPVIVVQGDCPLKIESFAVVLDVDNRYRAVYRVKNYSAKNVTSYRIGQMFDVGTGYIEFGVMPKNRILKSGHSTGTFDTANYLGGNAVYNGKLKAVAFLMIVSVYFDDGTSYTAEKTFDAIDERVMEYRVN